MPSGTMLANRRRKETPNLASMLLGSLGMPLDTTLENLRKTSQHHQKTPYLPQVIEGIPLDKKLENRRLSSQEHHVNRQ
jgi:hypothetical protein